MKRTRLLAAGAVLSLAGALGLAALGAAPASAAVASPAPASATPASPADATPDILSSGCITGYVCFFADSFYSPSGGSRQVLNYSATHDNWANQNDPADVCGGIVTHTWNDCASSLQSHMRTNNMWVWTDSHCSGMPLEIHPGEDIFNLGDDGFNDVISSDKVGSGQAGCSTS